MQLPHAIRATLCALSCFIMACGAEQRAAEGQPQGAMSPGAETPSTVNVPVADTEAATSAFRLYYRERVERAVMAHQRYGVFGDVSFATAIDRAHIAIDGDAIEVVAGPKDNNLIGTATWTTWEAYRIFGGRMLELATLRLFNGLDFYEAVSGHPASAPRSPARPASSRAAPRQRRRWRPSPSRGR